MNNFNKKELAINRSMSDAVFERFQEDLRKIYKGIRNDNAINVEAEFWDMQIRKEDTITLYYKGCAFNFKLKADDRQCTYKLSVSDDLKKYLNKFMDKNFLENMDSQTFTLSDFFTHYKCKFERIVNNTKFNTREIERKRQQYITALFEKDKDCIAIDYEVAVENVEDKLCKITFNKECKINIDNDEKTYKELDLLVLKKKDNGK